MLVAVTRDTHAAHTLEAELRAFSTGDTPILHFPDWETLPYDAFSPHAEIISQRVSTLYRLPSLARGLLVVPIATLMQRLAPREFMLGSNLSLSVASASISCRSAAGSTRRLPPRAQVLEPGDYATRGSLVDLFRWARPSPTGSSCSTRSSTHPPFDPETQRSLVQVTAVELLAAREFPLTEAATKSVRNTCANAFRSIRGAATVYQDLREGSSPPASSTTCRCSSSAPTRCSITSGAKRCSCSMTARCRRPMRSGSPRATATSNAATTSNGRAGAG